ncbi:hypothetical protein [Chitinophaga sp.]|uniref:hypothetical protein n=1 Tax=Chitinophaga sp. TaxID=1869181 RepID=UPI002607B319|nr:hypothetical protein [uncultured Chitinophaga sp.]
MQQENDNTNKRLNMQYRPMGELIRGMLFILFGLYALFSEKLGMGKLNLSETWLYILAGALGAYGLFRVYRGIKQLFF